MELHIHQINMVYLQGLTQGLQLPVDRYVTRIFGLSLLGRWPFIDLLDILCVFRQRPNDVVLCQNVKGIYQHYNSYAQTPKIHYYEHAEGHATQLANCAHGL